MGGGTPLSICLDTPGYSRICLHSDAAVASEVLKGLGGGSANDSALFLRYFYGLHHSLFHQCELNTRK